MIMQQSNLIEELNLNSVPEKERDVVLEKISQTIFEGVLIKSLEVLSEDDATELNKILDDNEDLDDVVIFLSDKIPQINEIVHAEVEHFRKSSLKFLENISN